MLFGGWQVQPTAACAQRARTPANGGFTHSIGQPKEWKWSGAVGAGAWFEGAVPNQFLSRIEVGVQRGLVAPDLALIGMGLEAYAGYRTSELGGLDGGVRALLTSGYLNGGIGAEYGLLSEHVNFLLRLETPLQRGGLFGSGGMVRLNLYPTESFSFTLGISHPLGQPRAGKTRPRNEKLTIATEFPTPVPYQVVNPELDAVLDSLRESAEWIRRSVVPFLDQDGRDTRIAEARMAAFVDTLARHLDRRSSEEEVRFFHAQVVRALSLAATNETAGRLAAVQARALLLDEVLLPYNSLLGRKKKKDTLVELGIAARGQFGRWVASSEDIPEGRRDQVLYVFQDLLQTLEDLRERSARQWDDPRLVWLPLQYALLPEDHDTQAEIDALIERAVARPLQPGNRVWYLANLQFHWELLRMIRETERYHVLWIHDFPARTPSGGLDWASFAQAVDGYLTTLAERVERYDETGVLPQFFIFHDQHYYEARKSRILMSLLEDPLAASGTLEGATEEQNRALQGVLLRLRRAVDSSRVLQAEARQYGSRWLRNRIKVQVNITYQADPSYFGGGIITTVFGYPDNLMRDHRKLAFYDVTEDDPYSGMAVYTGMGVGEQYLGSPWEDRALLLSGPALLDIKREARDLLLSHGLKPDELPEVFRERPMALDWTGVVARRQADSGWGARLMALNNRTGYEDKPLNVAKAILYSLMPRGSVVKIPDSLWNSMFFAGLLTGASCRGVRVIIIMPAQTNAPSAGFPQMIRAWELASRLVEARARLAPAIAESGGQLRVGFYALEVRENPFGDRVHSWLSTFAGTAFLPVLMPFVEAVFPVARSVGAHPDHDSTMVAAFPKLHQKVQFFANGAAWEALARAPEWPELMGLYLEYRRSTLSTTGAYKEARVFPERLEALAGRMYARMIRENGPGLALYAMVGSQNQDYRGMFMDGEVAVLLTGPESLVVLADLVFLEGAVIWAEDRATVDRLLRRPGEFERRFARIAKDMV